MLATIQDQAEIRVECIDKRKIVVQNGNLFPVETSEGLFLVRAASNCLQCLTAITMKDLKLFYMHKYDYFLSKNVVNWL